MKILHAVQNYDPAVGGMEEVVKQISRRVSSMGHEVVILTTYRSDRTQRKFKNLEVKDFKISGNLANGMTGEIKECREYLRNTRFDVIVCFAAQQWATDIFLENNFIESLNAKKVFVPTGFSGLYNPIYQSYFEKMPEWLNLFDSNIFLSDDYRDINFARKHNIKNTQLIPNGACEEEFLDIDKSIYEKKKDEKLIVHIGNHTGQKGHKELYQIFAKANVPKSKLVVIGSKNWKGRCYGTCKIRVFFYNLLFKIKGIDKKIELKTLNRNETIKHLCKADLFLFPSNIECSPIVLFEAMASKTAFLSSAAGNAEEIVKWSNAGEILPSNKDRQGRTTIDIDKSVEKLSSLLSDEQKLDDFAMKGFNKWKESYTWKSISEQYEKLYKDLANNTSESNA